VFHRWGIACKLRLRSEEEKNIGLKKGDCFLMVTAGKVIYALKFALAPKLWELWEI
jgi:hypothetical protein